MAGDKASPARTSCAYYWRVFRALFLKNLLLKLRSPLASVCEIILPILFVAAMTGLFSINFSTTFVSNYAYSPVSNYLYPAFQLPGPYSTPAGGAGGTGSTTQASYSNGAFRVMPLAGILPWRLNKVNARLAIVPSTPAQQPTVDLLLQHINSTYPALNCSNIGNTGVAFTNQVLAKYYFPSLLSQTVTFASEAALANYIGSSTYENGGYKIWAAIVINQNFPTLDYSIRMNSSSIPSTLPAEAVDPLQTGVDIVSLRQDVWSIPDRTGVGWVETPMDAIDQQPIPGFMSLQLMLDRWAINQSVPVSSMNQQLLLSTLDLLFSQMWNFQSTGVQRPYFVQSLQQLYQSLVFSNATLADQLVSIVTEFVGLGESYAPQQVDVIPFPTPPYKDSPLYLAISFSFGLFFILAWLYSVARFIRGVVAEKEAKISEGLRMSGLPVWISVASLIALYICIYVIIAAITAGLMKATIFVHCDAGLLFALVFLMGCSSAAYSYLVSVFFSSARTASTIGVLLYLGGYLPYYGVNTASTGTAAKIGASLLSPTAFGLAILQLCQYEQRGVGVTSLTVYNLQGNWSFFLSLLMMACDFPLYILLASYIRAVLPARFREYGVSRVWYFPCTPSFWSNELCCCFFGSSSRRNRRAKLPSGAAAIVGKGMGGGSHNIPPADPLFFEAPDPSLLAMEASGRTLKLQGIRKVFSTPDGDKLAVDDVNQTFYEGQISVLLGKNGAGKSTLLNILTGLYEATSGSVNVFGVDSSEDNYDSLYSSLGVVPQQDVLWPELTVREHLELFAAIKRVDKSAINSEIRKVLGDVGLTEKEYARTGTLSGGQKRKCCLAMALLGGSRLLVLDEITSGMDPYARRFTWACLQAAKRENRTIILCTHYLDEAEIIGDRIAIMASGSVRCAGSPLFLKQKFGLGYILTAVVEPNEDLTFTAAPAAGGVPGGNTLVIPRLLSILRAHVPAEFASQITIVGAAGQEIKIRLPMEAAPFFEPMLNALDDAITPAGGLQVLSYGVSVLSLEDVFLKAAAAAAALPTASTAASGKSLRRLPSKHLVGLPTLAAADDENESNGNGNSGIELASGASLASSASGASVGGSTEGLAVSSAHNNASVVPETADNVAVKAEANPAVNLQTIRSRGRRELKGCSAFRKHFVAIMIKRFAFARRDMRTLLCAIIIPFLLVAIGLALLRTSSLLSPQPSIQLSTAYYNTNPTSTAPVPIYPNYFPVGSFKAGLNASDDCALGITELLQMIPAANATTSMSGTGGPQGTAPYVPDSVLTYNVARAASLASTDTYGLSSFLLPTATAPATNWRSFATMLLGNDKNNNYGAATSYGALMLEGPSTYNMVPYQNASSVFCSSDTPDEASLTYTIFVNTSALASGPTFMNLVNSAAYGRSVAVETNSTATGRLSSITARSYPLPLTAQQSNLYSATLTGVAALLVQMAFSFIPAAWASFIVKERECGAKHQQALSGVSISAYWLANFFFDLLLYFIPCFATIGLFYAFALTDVTTSEQGQAQAFYGLFLLFGPSCIGFTYAVTFLFKSHTTAQTSILFANVACVLLFVISNVMSLVSSSACAIDSKLRFVYRLSPGFDLGQGIYQIGQLPSLAVTTQYCFPNDPVDTAALDTAQAYTTVSTGYNLLYMGVIAPIGLAAAILLDVFLSRPYLRAKLSRDPDVPEPLNDAAGTEGEVEDEDVAAERAAVDAKVARLLAGGSKGNEDLSSSVIIQRLRKVYRTGKGNKELKVAVRSLSFSVEPGQIFGFLGINGAGKSTTLSIVSGDVLPTSGTAYLAGHDILTEQQKVRRLLGYASQTDPLLDVLTTKEHLELYARIKGVPEALVASVVKEKLVEMDLVPFANRRAGTLSGGNKRKLVVACALISDPPVIALDEPSSGMDVLSQRFMWGKIAELRANKVSSIILTTHSMSECEALCDKVLILVNGQAKCLGSIAHIRHRHGRGYQCEVRLSPVTAASGATTAAELFDRLRAASALQLPADASLETVHIGKSAVAKVSEVLGDAARAGLIREDQDGWQLHNAFQRASPRDAASHLLSLAPSGTSEASSVPLIDFLLWWAQEDSINALTSFFTATFPGSSMTERQGFTLRFRIPTPADDHHSLGRMFGQLERAKQRLGIESYAVSQVSLESVFNSFASEQQQQQQQPKVASGGLGITTEEAAAAAAVPAKGGDIEIATAGAATLADPVLSSAGVENPAPFAATEIDEAPRSPAN
jgi:ATP-binding cassette, subfamily A (ABC1), member 12